MYTLVVTMNWNRFRKIFRVRFCIFYNRSELSHCIHIHWCIVMGLGHNDSWVESHMWPQQTWGQRSCRGQWPLVQVFGKRISVSTYFDVFSNLILQWLQKYVLAKAVETRGSRTALFGNDFFELNLKVCTEEDVYVQKLGFPSQNLFAPPAKDSIRSSFASILALRARGLFFTDLVKPSFWQRLDKRLKTSFKVSSQKSKNKFSLDQF